MDAGADPLAVDSAPAAGLAPALIAASLGLAAAVEVAHRGSAPAQLPRDRVLVPAKSVGYFGQALTLVKHLGQALTSPHGKGVYIVVSLALRIAPPKINIPSVALHN